MTTKELFGKSSLTQNIGAIPFLFWQGKTFKKPKERLSIIAEQCRKETKDKIITPKEREEYLIEYNKYDSIFSTYFKEIDNSIYHNFEQKLDYCIKQYQTMIAKLNSPRKLVLFHEDYYIGAEKTIKLYFLINNCKDCANRNEICKNKKQTFEEKDKPSIFIKSINNSLKLKKVCINKELFGIIDFDEIKNFNIIYKSDIKHLEYKNKRVKSDLITLLILLDKYDLIKIPSQKYIVQISKEVLNDDKVSTTLISQIYAKNSDPKKRSSNDEEAFKNISAFLDQFIC